MPPRFPPETTAPRRHPPRRGAVVAALPRVRRHAAALATTAVAATLATLTVLATLPRLRRHAAALTTAAVAISVAAATALTAGAPTAAAADSCPAADAACFDALPADMAWKQAIGLDAVPRRYQGDGVTVASIDTGVTPNPDLGSRLLARVDLTGDRDGLDHFGHGTHMAGLIAGDGSTAGEAFQGGAPEANLVSVKVAGWDGATDVSTVIAALQWVVANRERYGIRVVNLSWGTDATQGAGVDPLDLAVERAWQAGLVVVVAAGNGGPGPGTVAKPADDPYVITAGAADTGGTAARADDTVAAFSGRGPTGDGAAKPDVLAPGVALVSDRAPGSTIDALRPGARIGAGHFKGSGSSQAAAVVSGVAARILEANPALTNDQLKGVLAATADRALAGPAGGAGVIDARAAVAVVAARDGSPASLPTANAGLTPSTGLGTIQDSRGTQPVFGDLDGDGTADPVAGEIDVLGRPWSAAGYAAASWTGAAWAASPWAALTTELPGDSTAAAPAGPVAPTVAWAPDYWGARSWDQAGWEAKYWGAKYWGAKYWGAALWP